MHLRCKGVLVVARESARGRWVWCALVLAPLAFGGCNSGSGNSSDSSQAAPKSVLAPVGFSATADGFTVKLTWSADPGSAKILGYEIQRNGKPFATSSRQATSALDDGVRPGKQYRYEIRAKGQGSAASDWVADEVKIKVPPLRDARVEGDFGITGHDVSHYGYSKFEVPSFGWHFKPKCRSGACDVTWRDVRLKSVHAVINERHGRYHGTYRGYFFSSCGGTHSTSDVDLSFKPTKAKAIAGEWRATRIEGTLANTEASQFGCVAGHAEVAIKGTLRPAG